MVIRWIKKRFFPSEFDIKQETILLEKQIKDAELKKELLTERQSAKEKLSRTKEEIRRL